MSNQLAEAVCRNWDKLPPEAISIILDVDPEAGRGFGTIDALKKLNEKARKRGTAIYEDNPK